MSSETHTHTEDAHDEHAGMSKKDIFKIFYILLGITAVEFLIALVLVPKAIIPLSFANPLYIILTLLKAFYIVAYFMHLKFEKVGLAYSIGVPILFIVGLILVLTNESHHWADVWNSFGL